MISPEEEKFFSQWEVQRTLPHYKRSAFLRGLSLSLLVGLLVLVFSELGWYERANMQANSWGNEIWILIAIVAASFGFAYLYQQFTTEMNEQRFIELKQIKNKK